MTTIWRTLNAISIDRMEQLSADIVGKLATSLVTVRNTLLAMHASFVAKWITTRVPAQCLFADSIVCHPSSHLAATNQAITVLRVQNNVCPASAVTARLVSIDQRLHL